MRILWIKTELLHPVDKGGRIRTYHMLRSLSRHHHVTYLCLDDGFAAPDALERAREYAQEVVRIFRHTLGSGESYQAVERPRAPSGQPASEYYDWRVDRIPLPEGGYGVVCYFREVSVEAAKAHQMSGPNARWLASASAITVTPAASAVISSASPSRRHIRPCPAMKYQISSTVRWATAFDTPPGASRKAAMLPRVEAPKSRTSAPSGAIASGAAGITFVAKADGMPHRPLVFPCKQGNIS